MSPANRPSSAAGSSERTQRVILGRTFLMVTDPAGNVVAAGFPPDDHDDRQEGPSAMLGVLPGQTLHEVALPIDLERAFTSAESFHRALAGYVLRSGPARSLLLPRIETGGAPSRVSSAGERGAKRPAPSQAGRRTR